MTILWQNGAGSPKRVGPDDWTKDEDFVEIVFVRLAKEKP